ncbi:MAG: hypothetical protein JSU03_00810 [Bacteroidetes bacterium]|nr:hypothetical protein [Bacteroidota bacterium]MBS1755792.1 hypothetical protein [Bacteroidota bacterium]
MKKITVLLLLSMAIGFTFAQKPTKEQYEADKKKMIEAQKKLDAAKAAMTPETRKQFDDMMEKMGANKAMQNAQQELNYNSNSKPVLQRTTDPNIIPDKPSTLKIAATPQSKEQLIAYLKPIFSQTESAMKPEHKKAVQSLLNKGAETGKYAMVFWTHNEFDKTMYLLLNACISSPDDFVSINNLGALLIISGYAHKALPLLLYTQKFVPQSGTLLNNVGQAYLSLGNVEKAQSLFSFAVAKDSTQSEAYRSMALIAHKQGNQTLCASYLEKAIANGGATSEAINLLSQVAPDIDLSEAIRNRFKQFYKDHSVTKRFIVPAIPASYEEAVERDNEVETYFRDFDATINATYKTQQQLNKQYENQVQANATKKMAQMQQVMANAGKPGFEKSMQDMKASLKNPFLAQGAVMLSSIDNPKFSKSYYNRMKTETEKRLQAENELKQGLKTDYDNKISALTIEKSKLKDGEGQDAANARAVEIEKELCELKIARQNKWLSKSAEINNQYIHNMEDLLNQRLQEYLFWNTIVMQSMQDPTAVNYAYYVSYLKNLYDLAYHLFPTHVDGGLSKPCEDYLKANNYRGKIHDWEREHCEVDFGFDAMVMGAKMNCEGWSVYADFKAESFKYEASTDPVTCEYTEHSISVKAGKDKEFKMGNIKGSIGASVETTVKFDGNLNPVDLIVKGAAGAGLSGPMGGSASAELGSAEISVRGGFNSSGPGFTPFGSDFLK